MLAIRLTRVGKKKDASFRVIVVDSKRKVKAGNYLEMVGSYDPRVDSVSLKADRIKHWLAHGAKTSDTVHNLLISQKVIEGKKINVLPRKSLPKAEEPKVKESKIEEPETESHAAPSESLAKEGEDTEVAPETAADTIQE